MKSVLPAMLDEARAGLWRLSAPEAHAAAIAGALIVDIRPEVHRRGEGVIPGSIAIERNELEWRLDPAGDHRTDALRVADQVVVLVCNEGYASSLAAATLQSLGLVRATDLVGGFRAWRAAGLPVVELSAGVSRRVESARCAAAGG